MFGLARALARTHRAVHEVHAPRELPGLRHVLATRITGAVMPPHLRDHALRILDRLPDGDRLCHGDYHPANVLVARTMLLLRWADPLPGTGRVARVVMAAGRSAFAHRHASAYRSGSPRRSPRLHGWLVVHAAARLAEGIETEEASLIAFLDRTYRS